MAIDLLDQPPFNRLDHIEVVALLNDAFADDDDNGVGPDGSSHNADSEEDEDFYEEDCPPTRSEVAAKVAPDDLVAILTELERGTIMEVSSYGLCSSTVCFAWVWHPRLGCGLLYDFCRDIPLGESTLVPLTEKNCRHIADQLKNLFRTQAYLPMNFVDAEVLMPLDGITASDLATALAEGVFSEDSEYDDPARAAADWVNRHASTGC